MEEVEKERLKKPGTKKMECKTQQLPLIGADMKESDLKFLYQDYPPPLVNHLYSNYGSHLTYILDGNL